MKIEMYCVSREIRRVAWNLVMHLLVFDVWTPDII